MKWAKTIGFILFVSIAYSILAAWLGLGEIGTYASPVVGVLATFYAIDRWDVL